MQRRQLDLVKQFDGQLLSEQYDPQIEAAVSEL